MSRVTVTYENHIAQVRLTRADKMNAVDEDMIQSIIAAGRAVAETDVRAVVLSGDGNGFCAGIDVMSFASMAGQDTQEMMMPRSHGDTNRWQEVSLVWRRVPVPVIAAIHGVCFGAGFQLALGADIRFAAPATKMSVMEIKWGLVPDMGGMVLLPHLTRSDVIRMLTYTGRQFTSEEAQEWGLVTSVVEDPMRSALDLATEIATKSPSAIREAKALIEVGESDAREAILLAESQAQANLIGGADQMEVIAAQMQKRAPVFK